MDVYDLPELGLDPFDITIFGGLFDQLAIPVSGLKIAADLTKELMIFDTATKWGMDDDSLVVAHEGTEALMPGVPRSELGALRPRRAGAHPGLGGVQRHPGDALGADGAHLGRGRSPGLENGRGCWMCSWADPA